MNQHRATVLLVDDDVGFLSILEKALREVLPYTIVTATDGKTALALCEEHIPDVIVSDYYMPVMDGFALCRAVKEHSLLRESMFMMLTSATDINLKVQGFDSGADDYLTKPFQIEELVARIKALLRLKVAQDELKAGKRELARLNAELEDSFLTVVRILTDLIELKIPNASARSERAADIAQWIGQRLECTSEELRQLEIAARLHEIGKIRISDETLRKTADERTAEEREMLMQFPVYGEHILKTIPRLQGVAKVLRHQMENYDGTGFPDKLMKEEISLFSRIIRSINFLEQIVSQGIKKHEHIVAEVRKGKGLQLDPRIAQLLEEYIYAVETPSWLEDKRQITVYELKEGMIMATDLYTGNGVKLLSKGATVTSPIIERILSHHQVDPIVNLIYVYS